MTTLEKLKHWQELKNSTWSSNPKSLTALTARHDFILKLEDGDLSRLITALEWVESKAEEATTWEGLSFRDGEIECARDILTKLEGK